MATEKSLATRDRQATGITQASLDATAAQLGLLESFVRKVLREGEDYGPIPGTSGKSTLLKPGASNVISAYNCHAIPRDPPHEIIDLDKGFIFYRVQVDVFSNIDGELRASGLGSCSSYETKYRYRDQKRKCPACSQAAIIKGNARWGGGWVCWKKQGGCGASFKDGDQKIESQPVGRVVVEDPMEQANTILKMAEKRAEVDAAMRLPGVARFFTQDIEDMEPDTEAPKAETTTKEKPPAQAPGPQTPAPAPASQEGATAGQEQASTASPKRTPSEEYTKFWELLHKEHKSPRGEAVTAKLGMTLEAFIRSGHTGAEAAEKVLAVKPAQDEQGQV